MEIGKPYEKWYARVCLDTKNVWERGEIESVGKRERRKEKEERERERGCNVKR